MQKKFYCYKITLTQEKHELFNHYYYGARITTKDIEKDYYKGSSSKIRKSGYWDLYPLDYKKEIIKTFDNAEDLYKYEYQLIGDNYKTDPLCLNMFIGGVGGHSTWGKLDDDKIYEIHSKAGKNNKGKKHILKHPEITSKRLSNANKGKKRSDETRKNISAAALKRPLMTEEHKKKISEALKGRKRNPVSEETRKKLSNSLIERYKNEDYRKMIADATKNGMLNQEVRAKCALGGKIQKGKIFINKDNINKRVKLEELEHYINIGWKKGRYTPWIKHN